jgi:Superfamily II helicase
MKIGFPVVVRGEQFNTNVWVSVIARDKPGQLLLNTEPINLEAFKFGYIRELVSGIMGNPAELSLHLDCTHWELLEYLRQGQKIDGSSAALCMAFARDYAFERHPDDSLSLALTGTLAPGAPRPKSVGDLAAKYDACKREHATGLVLCWEDFETLRNEPDISSSPVLDLDDPCFSQKISQHHDLPYLIPLPDTDDWCQKLGTALKLDRRRALATPLEQGSGEGRSDDDQSREDEPGPRLRDLFLAALPLKLFEGGEHGEENHRELTRLIWNLPRPYNDRMEENTFTKIAWDRQNESPVIFNTNYYDLLHQHIVMAGPTSTGKTTLAKALILNTLAVGKSAIFVAPTRALVYEAHKEFQDFLKLLLHNGRIPGLSLTEEEIESQVILSTGEKADRDWRILRGEFKVVFSVYEKANLFMNVLSGDNSSENVGLCVIDELHMLADPLRGGVLDLFLAKVLRLAHKAWRDRKSPPRLVCITTETAGDSAGQDTSGAIQSLLTYPAVDGRSQPVSPVMLPVCDRPIQVHHFLLPVLTKATTTTILPAERIVSFQNSSDRILLPGAIAEKRERVSRTLNASEINGQGLDDFLISRRHRKVIIVFQSITALWRRAKDLLTLRRQDPGQRLIDWAEVPVQPIEGTKYCTAEQLQAVYDALKEGAVTQQEKSDMWALAQYGIFLYYGPLSYGIREEMSAAFRHSRRSAEAFRPTLLLGTDALAYGINLPADGIVLTFTMPVKENPDKGRFEQTEMSMHEYHNILGRIGRLGHMDTSVDQNAYIYVHTAYDVDRVLKMYGPVRPLNPATFTPDDAHKARQKTLSSMSRLSYPAFRSAVDSLRFASLVTHDGKIRIADIRDVMSNTLYFKALGYDQGFERFEQFMQQIMDVVHNETQVCQGRELLGKEQEGNGEILYKSKEMATALIDTGTRWQSILPMQKWLEELKALHKSGLLEELPVELLIPGILATPMDLWASMRRFSEEVDWTQGHQTEDPTADKWAEELLSEELRHLLPLVNQGNAAGNPIKQVFNIIKDFALSCNLPLSDDSATQYSDGIRRNVFIRLTAALLKWLRGASPDDIQKTYWHRPREQQAEDFIPPFSTRYVEKAYWLARMCLRFFAGEKDLLLENHEQQLQQLALRLRHGVKKEGIPFMGRDHDVTRVQVMALLDSGITASELLLDNDPLLYLIERKPGLDRDGAGSHLNHVLNYYEDSIQSFCGFMGFRGATAEQHDALKSIARLIPKIMPPKYDPDLRRMREQQPGAPILMDLLVPLASDSGTRIGDQHMPLEASCDINARRLWIRQREHRITMALTDYNGQPDSNDTQDMATFIVYVPWKANQPGNARDGLNLSLAGCILILRLLCKGALSLSKLINWMRSQRESRPAGSIHTVKSLISSARQQSGLPDIRRYIDPEWYKEALMFDEPDFH